MSIYHTNCNTPSAPEETKNKAPRSTQPKLTSKPFCDCHYCICNDCPDILKMFSITVTENSCDFGPKVNKDCKVSKSEPGHSEETVNEINNLLQNVNQDKNCGCEVVARAVISNVHTNMGLTHVRKDANTEECDKTSENISNK